uniref:Uncharacterized protein n=1 Tax=Sphaeramia orbicularis TaxID=375764 RepID=A0A672ZQ23_9TELE
MQRCTMGIYVMSKENGVPGHSDDVGIFVEGVLFLDSYLGSEAQPCAVMHGMIYELNLADPKELRHYYEFIQKELMQMDEEKLFQGLRSLSAFLVYSVTCDSDFFFSR